MNESQKLTLINRTLRSFKPKALHLRELVIYEGEQHVRTIIMLKRVKLDLQELSFLLDLVEHESLYPELFTLNNSFNRTDFKTQLLQFTGRVPLVHQPRLNCPVLELNKQGQAW